MRREIGWLADRRPMLVTEDEKTVSTCKHQHSEKDVVCRRTPIKLRLNTMQELHAPGTPEHKSLLDTATGLPRDAARQRFAPQPNNTDEICDHVIGNIRSARAARIYDVHHLRKKEQG
ncbi:hypothetical protein [Xanthomonas campestris]|uniref:Uncharacterized protein n=1 Tax=Xanthomonas campestris pv. papavericola TaxID=487881 RepID=A0AAJ2X3G8_XANCA|nr:hypothetical protein [Xanthomonas campestris]MCW2002070.1 hypothetical protein [Xanthomonas campestris]MEC3888596.1 hypothetical protein [Xanthomonas campestris pv. papavericola]